MKQLDIDFADSVEKYRWWDILDELPNGWVIDKTAGSPAPMTVFITNGKSPLNGQKRALLRVMPKEVSCKNEVREVKASFAKIENIPKPYVFPAKSVNDLARLKFQEQLLKEIMFDLAICDIEGWDKREYISELRNMLNGINIK